VADPSNIGSEGCCDAVLSHNSKECKYDGGDFPLPSPVDGYPNYLVSFQGRIRDRECDGYLPYNSYECGFDGDDCCCPKFAPTSSLSESIQPSLIPSTSASRRISVSQSPSVSPSISAGEPSISAMMPT